MSRPRWPVVEAMRGEVTRRRRRRRVSCETGGQTAQPARATRGPKIARRESRFPIRRGAQRLVYSRPKAGSRQRSTLTPRALRPRQRGARRPFLLPYAAAGQVATRELGCPTGAPRERTRALQFQTHASCRPGPTLLWFTGRSRRRGKAMAPRHPVGCLRFRSAESKHRDRARQRFEWQGRAAVRAARSVAPSARGVPAGRLRSLPPRTFRSVARTRRGTNDDLRSWRPAGSRARGSWAQELDLLLERRGHLAKSSRVRLGEPGQRALHPLAILAADRLRRSNSRAASRSVPLPKMPSISSTYSAAPAINPESIAKVSSAPSTR